jgi:parallel beta-helix repeat protein
MSRLLKEAKKGENSITVETGLDWVPGDRIALLATSYARAASDDVFIETYDNTTGILTINSTLNHYHWGQANTTVADYNGIDIRGEVVLLSRNVKIVGEDVESWGGQIVTSDSVEVIEGVVTMRTGQLLFDNVEVYNSSQIDTLKAAIRFESAATLHSSVTNCTLHNGLGWGMYMKSSKNIQVSDNIFYNFRPIGVAMQAATNVTFNDNVLGLIT